MKKNLTLFLTVLALLVAGFATVSCGGKRQALLPNVSGKAGEILVVIEKTDWEGAVGNATRELLACDCPWFLMREPLYSLSNVTHGGFADIFKVHRNIVYFDIDPMVKTTRVKYLQNVWAAPQAVVNISAPDSQTAVELLERMGPRLSPSSNRPNATE